jgi:WD repeat-containing protein 1 (actin-interacting protein 1)
VGHNKIVNSCHIRANRPFKAVTCSDDMTVNFYAGPPYKFVKSINDHTRFVQSVRFSPDGNLFVSVGSDARIYVYDGTTADKKAEVLDGHTGSIFSVSWSADSKQYLTSSADGTVKFWDAATNKAVNTVAFSGGVDDQQVGNLWAGSHILSLSLSGDFNYLDPRQKDVVRKVYGHQKAITSFATNWKEKTFFTGSYDGRVYSWNADDGLAKPVSGKGHSNQVSSLAVNSSKVATIGMDDVSKSIDLSNKSFE